MGVFCWESIDNHLPTLGRSFAETRLAPSALCSVQTVIPLDVDLLNGRAYVQGSQVLARLCSAPQLEGAVLVHAKFSRLTDRLLAARPDVSAYSGDATAIGTVEFARDGASLVFGIVELPDVAPPAARPLAVTLAQPEHDGALTGLCRFSEALGADGVLDAIVQAIKSLHEQMPEPTCDIWFTGLRGWALPTRGLPVCAAGTVDVQCLRRSSGAGRVERHQSLLRVAVRFAERTAPLEGLVTFAWRTPGVTDVT